MTEFWIGADGYRVRCLRCEPRAAAGTRPPVFLIHGFLGYVFSWRYNLAALAEHAPVYAIDLPGVGLSARAPECGRSFQDVATTVLACLKTLGLGVCDLVATSHGGAVGMVLAATAPGQIRRMVLVDPVHPWSRHGRRRIRFLRSQFGSRMMPVIWSCVRLMRVYFVRRMYGDPARIPPGTADGYYAPTGISGTCEHLWQSVRTWESDLLQLEKLLPRIANLPTLLIWGSRDRAVPAESAALLREHFTRARLMILEGAGHLPYEEMPEEFNRIVNEFLE
jgi:pimeloyl-ACP methyl ester carboxylesterase